MSRIVSIHQPHYYPWFGLLDKISKSDVHVILDNVQYNKRSFQHRTLYSSDPKEKYLSLSVDSKGTQSNGLLISDVRISDNTILSKHFKTLEQRYSKSRGWDLVCDDLYKIYATDFEKLIDLNMELLKLTLRMYRLSPEVVFASALQVNASKGALMHALTKASGGTIYLSGNGAREYMNNVREEERLVHVVYQDFVHPVYKQRVKNGFQEGTFALEMLIEEGESAIEMYSDSCSVDQSVRCFVR